MLLVLLVSLYTVRVLLEALGQQDYGLYNVVGGIVVMFSFLTHVLSSASHRFFAFEIGQRNYTKLSRIYSLLMILYVIVIIAVVALAETVGLWFLHNKMTIPPDRMHAADIVYQFSILSFCWKIFTAPHTSIIIAHEKMDVYAYVGVAEVVLQLIMVLCIRHAGGDRLIEYSVLMFAVVFVVNSIYIIYSKIKFKEVHFKFRWDKELASDVVSYSGWTLFGAVASVVRSQGINIILNVYFNPVVNAARGIAHSVNSALSSFSGNFYTAVKPQIVKYYAKGDSDSCFKLVFRSTKFSYFLLLVLMMPIFLYTPEILTLWLKEYPDYAVNFTRLIMVTALIESMSNPLITFNQATGDVKLFQIVVSLIFILNLPIAILVLELGGDPYSAFIVSICLSAIAFATRLFILKRQHGFPVGKYVEVVLLRLLMVTLICTGLSLALYWAVPRSGSLLLLFACVLAVMAVVAFVSLFLGFNKQERKFAINMVTSKFRKKS